MKIALLGNPNTGKSSVFNMLTGLRQSVGNFPGVTVDRKEGVLTIDEVSHQLIDFPGTYSIYPRSQDEQIVYDVLSNPEHSDFPDLAVVVVDASNLKRNLFLFTQIYDLGLPCVLVLNMSDLANKKGINIDSTLLKSEFARAEIVEATARVGLGKGRIVEAIKNAKSQEVGAYLGKNSLCAINDAKCHEEEAERRFSAIDSIIEKVISHVATSPTQMKNRLDKVLTHSFWGYFIFAAILLLVFQSIFSFAAIPMDFIDGSFGQLSAWLKVNLPIGVFSDLISQGIVPGIGGVIIFVPQIALLFFFMALLEESGYLARAVFILDRIMRPLGLNGRSAVPLLSSVACAIPGVMAARTIANRKERLITILVAPLMSCSARIPVYTLLIALVIPSENFLGVFNYQGLVLFGLYFLGLFFALLVAFVLKLIIKSNEPSLLLLELPTYKIPRWKNVSISVFEKVKVFVLDAGKMILAISILLWALATFGPSGKMDAAEQKARREGEKSHLSALQVEKNVASTRLENSYIGHVGRFVEPAIQPLGYDWKIGISLLTSFVAREVFVGSLATIYAVQDTDVDHHRLVDRLKAEEKADGTPVFSFAVGLSLMVYYVFAMQCMTTLVVVRQETKSWRIPIVQLLYMGVLAYLGAFIVFQLFK
ncbi:MAG: ferrous iron transporter B [Bacteroidota bacterium]